MHALALSAAALSAVVTVPAEASGPRLPYLDWGACPLEGCAYQSWQVARATTVWQRRDRRSPVAYRVQVGKSVEALTGVVITYKPGISKVLVSHDSRSGSLGGRRSRRRPLDPPLRGEGCDLFWFGGRTYVDQIASHKPDPEPLHAGLKIQVVSRPRSIWWVKLKNGKGQTGWTVQSGNFSYVSVLE